MFDDPRRPTESAGTFVACLEYRIVEKVHVASHPLLAVCKTHLAEGPVGHVPTAARRAVTASRHIAPGIERADGDSGIGYGDQHVLYVAAFNRVRIFVPLSWSVISYEVPGFKLTRLPR